MSKFVCENPDCERYGIEDEYLSNRYKMIGGQLVSDNAPCPKCGSIRREVNLYQSVPLSEKNISIGEYTMSSPEERKEMLKKRSHDHYMKEVKPYKDHQMNQVMSEFKNMK